MSTSTIPGCIDALVTLFTTAALAGYATYDGHPADLVTGQVVEDADDYITVAIADADNPAVEGTEDDPSGGPLGWHEDYTVHCQISTWSGDGTMKSRRDRAYAQYDACEAAVRGNPSLGVLNGLASTGGHSMVQSQSPQGPVVTINFGVHVSADRM